MFRSLRAKLQTVFFVLGLTAIGLTGWEASAGAASALEKATFERLIAIRQTRIRQVQRYFQDLAAHATALAADDSVLEALDSFRAAWRAALPATSAEEDALRAYYASLGQAALTWFPKDRLTIAQQHHLLAGNPHPHGAKDRLLEAPGAYGKAHARFHPTFHRYRKAFGFYDILLVDAEDLRVVYSVLKEIDFGVTLRDAPYRESPLGHVVEKARGIEDTESWVLRDYEPYLPSSQDTAAFIATPVFRAGVRVGYLVMQVSLAEINRVITNDHQWSDEGMGRTGHVYAVGPDHLLRSDTRLRIAAAPEVARLQGAEAATAWGRDLRGVRVLRSHAPLAVAGLDWTLVAEIEAEEALAPVRALRERIFLLGLPIAAGFLLAAAWLARSVTRPIQALTAGLDRLGNRDFSAALVPESRDEIGQLTSSFNRIAAELARTTVSKEELERLAGELLTAQEDERRRIARELHDGVTQQLAALAIEAGQLAKLPQDDSLQGLARIREQAARLSDDVHRLSRNLHPALLEDLGLAAAIEQECRGFFERGGPPVDFEQKGEFDDLPKEARIVLYRITQEALRNIEKHGSAQNVGVLLERSEHVHLRVSDDGRGFDSNSPEWRRGLGLTSMEERVRPLGGRLEVKSRLGEGTEVNVWLN
jgi:methyl-accepting chemotaxis protein